MSPPLRLVAGRIFAGDYKVVKPLKAGGQGSLYVVEQVSTSKLRALKLMLPELVAQPSSRRRFELEAKIAARIQSDHVVESIASGVDVPSGTPWLVMELLEGEDLAVYTQKKRHLPAAEVLEIFSQLCHALGEAHRQGIIHRDLKPENIFLATPRRRGVPFMVKVLDFGIARILAESQTQSGSTTSGLGTPMWMAPEQTVPGSTVGPGTDVWPMGLLAFRLLTGYLFWKSPYDPGASVMMLMAEAFMHPLPTATERAAHYKCADRLPPGFDAWFARCVARPMPERFADATEAFAALEPLLAGFGVEGLMPSRVLPGGDRASAPNPAVVSHTPSKRSAADPRSAPVPAVSAFAPLPTGPGLATWAGAPELAPDAVRSVVDAEPAPKGTPPPVPVTLPRAKPRAAAAAVTTGEPAATASKSGETPPPAPADKTPAPAIPVEEAPDAIDVATEPAADASAEPEAPAPAGEPEAPALTSGTPAPATSTPVPATAITASTPAPATTTPIPAAAVTTGDVLAPATTTGETLSSRTADQAPPVQTTTPPAPDHRARNVVISATLIGVLLGAALFALQSGGSATPSSAADSASAAVPAAPPPATTTTTMAAQPSTSATSSGAVTASGEPMAKAAHGMGKQCKPAGAKCFAHDDCCDRICRKWVCRSNAAMQDPYADPK